MSWSLQNECLQFSGSISSQSGICTTKGCGIKSGLAIQEYSSLLHTRTSKHLRATVRLCSILLVRFTLVFMIMVGRPWLDILEGHITKYGLFPSSTSHEYSWVLILNMLDEWAEYCGTTRTIYLRTVTPHICLLNQAEILSTIYPLKLRKIRLLYLTNW